MAKSRIITARLKFSPAKQGGDLTEAELVAYLARQLEFAPGLKVETIADIDWPAVGLAALKEIEAATQSSISDAKAADRASEIAHAAINRLVARNG